MIMIFLTIILVVLALSLALSIVYIVGLWQVFKKAGRSGWEAIIPFYNSWVLAEISGSAWWYALIIIISGFGIVGGEILVAVFSLASIVANFFIFYNLSKKFNKGVGTAVLLFLFPIIMIPIMGFSKKYQYDRNIPVSINGPFGDSTNGESYYSNNTNNFNDNHGDEHYCHYCGRQINVNSRFCGNCGNEVNR